MTESVVEMMKGLSMHIFREMVCHHLVLNSPGNILSKKNVPLFKRLVPDILIVEPLGDSVVITIARQ